MLKGIDVSIVSPTTSLGVNGFSFYRSVLNRREANKSSLIDRGVRQRQRKEKKSYLNTLWPICSTELVTC